MRIGNHLLTEKGSYDQARKHFEAAASEENADDAMRAEATLNQGTCFFEAQLYGKCFTCLLYTSPSPRDYAASRMPSSA